MRRKKFCVFLIVAVPVSAMCFGGTIFVDDSAAGANDGSSWTNAFVYFQDALSVAAPDDLICVAQGTYRPDQSSYLDGLIPGDRKASFRLKSGITIRGGFAGVGAADPDARDIVQYQTILSGDLRGDDTATGNRGDNAYHVVLVGDSGIEATLEGVTISNGNANGDLSSLDYHGGGIKDVSGRSTLILERCTITDNQAFLGGGICGGSLDDPWQLRSCRIAGNHAVYDGGGFMIWGDAELLDCVLEGNDAGRNGGALIIDNDSFSTIRSCRIASNTAGNEGGGMYFQFAFNMDISNCLVEDNIAGDNGGGVFNGFNSYILYSGCDFLRNQAGDQGGGVFNDRTTYSGLLFYRCRLIENYAHDEGGGMYTWGRDAGILVSESLFENNHSDGDGGGLQNDGGDPWIEACQFRGNTAGNEGGGLCNEADKAEELQEPTSSPVLRGCLFAGNSASRGGAIHSDQGELTLEQCTIAKNSAENGGGISGEEGAGYSLNGCILWDNLPDEIDHPSSMTQVMFSDIQGGWPGEGNRGVDPMFADSQSGDYHLKSQGGRWDSQSQTWIQDEVTSPCIDAGDPATPIMYEPFPNGGVVNMGAYGGTAEASKSWFGGPLCEVIVAGDINGDCTVDLADFAILSQHWLWDGQQTP